MCFDYTQYTTSLEGGCVTNSLRVIEIFIGKGQGGPLKVYNGGATTDNLHKALEYLQCNQLGFTTSFCHVIHY